MEAGVAQSVLASRLQARRSMVRILAAAINFFFLLKVQKGSGAELAFFSMVTGVIYLG